MSKRKAVEETQLRPCLQELLRTCVHPQSMTLRIEEITNDTVTEDDKSIGLIDRQSELSRRPAGQYLRLLVSDGFLQIQAVLHRQLRFKRELRSLKQGDLINVRKFEVRKGKRINGSGSVVYIGIQAFEVLFDSGSVDSEAEGGFVNADVEDDDVVMPHDSPTGARRCNPLKDETPTRKAMEVFDETQAGGFLREDIQPPRKKVRIYVDDEIKSPIHSEYPVPTLAESSLAADSDEETFELMPVDSAKALERRQILHKITHAAASTSSRLLNEDLSDPDDELQEGPENPSEPPRLHHTSIKTILPKSETAKTVNTTTEAGKSTDRGSDTPNKHPHVPATQISRAPIHTLGSLSDQSNDLPKRNYTCSVLAVVSWTSSALIHRPKTPFPPKRHIKLHDPTIAARHAGVTLAVFVDAKTFHPKIGTVALFRGLTMQRWGGDVILNAYESLGRAAEPWVIDDADELARMGLDGDGMAKWWENRALKKGVIS